MVEHSEKFEEQKTIKSTVNCEGTYECRGRIQGV